MITTCNLDNVCDGTEQASEIEEKSGGKEQSPNKIRNCDFPSCCHLGLFCSDEQGGSLRCAEHKKSGMRMMSEQQEILSESAKYVDLSGLKEDTPDTSVPKKIVKNLCVVESCQFYGSYNFPSKGTAGMCCYEHSLPGMTLIACNYKKCNKVAVYQGKGTNTHVRRCDEHIGFADNEMRMIQRKKCEVKNCYFYGSYNFKSQGTAGRCCHKHKLPGMTFIRCNYKECNKAAVHQGMGTDIHIRRCDEHISFADIEMVMIQGKECEIAGCEKKAEYNTSLEDYPRFCEDHRTEGLTSTIRFCEVDKAKGLAFVQKPISAKPSSACPIKSAIKRWKSCEHNGCEMKAFFNYPGNSERLFCFHHKLEKMVFVGNQKDQLCLHPGCTTYASFGFPGEQARARCSRHRLDGMVYYRTKKYHRQCGSQECSKKALYRGVEEDHAVWRCYEHKLPKMVPGNVKVCQHKGCPRPALFNLQGQKKPSWCEIHKEEGMVYLFTTKAKFCEAENCMIGAIFNHPGSTSGRFCNQHKAPGMRNVLLRYKSQCCVQPGCEMRPVYFFPQEGYSTQTCARHRKAGMIRIRNICAAPGCMTYSGQMFYKRIGKNKYSKWCATHQQSDMVPVRLKEVEVKCAKEGCEAKCQVSKTEVDANVAVYCTYHKYLQNYRRCAIEGCLAPPGARFFRHKVDEKKGRHKRWCFEHKLPGMIEYTICAMDGCRGKAVKVCNVPVTSTGTDDKHSEPKTQELLYCRKHCRIRGYCRAENCKQKVTKARGDFLYCKKHKRFRQRIEGKQASKSCSKHEPHKKCAEPPQKCAKPQTKSCSKHGPHKKCAEPPKECATPRKKSAKSPPKCIADGCMRKPYKPRKPNEIVVGDKKTQEVFLYCSEHMNLQCAVVGCTKRSYNYKHHEASQIAADGEKKRYEPLYCPEHSAYGYCSPRRLWQKAHFA